MLGGINIKDIFSYLIKLSQSASYEQPAEKYENADAATADDELDLIQKYDGNEQS